jgi:hypothetical protein
MNRRRVTLTGILLFSVASWATELLESLSLASLGRSAIAELAGPALEFPSVIERMMLPKFLGRLKAE